MPRDPRDPVVRCEHNTTCVASGRDPALEHANTCRKPARWFVRPSGRSILDIGYFCTRRHGQPYVEYQARCGYDCQVTPLPRPHLDCQELPRRSAGK